MEDESANIPELYEELFSLFRDGRSEIVRGSIELLLDQTETESLIEYILKNPKKLRIILLLIGSDVTGVSENAMKSLINLSQKTEIAEELCINLNAIEYSMDNLMEQIKPCSSVPYHLTPNLMFISNLTRCSTGRNCFITRNKQRKNAYFLFLFECLSNTRSEKEVEMALNIINNCTSCEEGRNSLFDYSLGIEVLNKISNILLDSLRCDSSKNIDIVISIISHVCVDRNLHKTIVSEKCRVIPTLCCVVYPDESHKYLRTKKSGNTLMELQNKTILFGSSSEKCNINIESNLGNEIYSLPERKNNDQGFADSNSRNVSEYIVNFAVGPVNCNISQDIFDCLLVVSSTVEGRQLLRKHGAYEVLRVWHLYEEKVEIITGIENIIHLLVYSEEELLEQDNNSGYIGI
ncbi:Armadillo-type fold containing protein [Cryptosporidium felis]|nr:Armadillo-type fold containing protein [Cryptosporidium felis]